MSDILLNEVIHDQVERRDVALRVALDDGYRGIFQESRISESLEEPFTCFLEIRLRRRLRESNDPLWA
ncbi:MAG TPA: hypothetical protein VF042_14985 [Gemmatimonadaceae bacterium]